jgi:hypothetical protein
MSQATNGKLADRTNLLGMRPSHLASSLQVLQLLHSYEGDLASADGKGRTPLFIACALGRHDCATFLCDILRHDDDYLRKVSNKFQKRQSAWEIVFECAKVLPNSFVLIFFFTSHLWRSCFVTSNFFFQTKLQPPCAPCLPLHHL